ncbi:hypothetical protein CQ12_15605 [Bradyrhizobium jicamae]|uniref:Uncharacterized protein n=1 Tax=Bradyrhizobium jicamae TaxID=280332 RepID=A0A0R3L3N4_9BRAD|nr:hypothetical protein CQ12_15605 [Bradyrhizobium jicamae]
MFSFPGAIFPEFVPEEKLVGRGGSRHPHCNKLEMMHATIGLPRHPGLRNFAQADRPPDGRFR